MGGRGWHPDAPADPGSDGVTGALLSSSSTSKKNSVPATTAAGHVSRLTTGTASRTAHASPNPVISGP